VPRLIHHGMEMGRITPDAALTCGYFGCMTIAIHLSASAATGPSGESPALLAAGRHF
jgi:hypothetical protein